MKHTQWIMPSLLCLMLLAGCVPTVVAPDSPAVNASDTPIATDAPVAADTPVVTTSPIVTASTAEDYTVSLETLTDANGLQVNYPQLSGLANNAKQNELNAFFKQAAQLSLTDLAEGTKGQQLWEVTTKQPGLLSLVCRSYWEVPESAHPWSACVAYSINPATGEYLRLAELCDIEAMAADLAAANATADQTAYTAASTDGTDVTEYVTPQELMSLNGFMDSAPDAAGIKALLERVDVSKADGFDSYSYWKDGQLHLVFGYIHAVGDYVDLSIAEPHTLKP